MNTSPATPTSFANWNSDAADRPASPPDSGAPARVDVLLSSAEDEVHSAVDATANAGKDAIGRVAGGIHGAVHNLADKAQPLIERVKSTYDGASELPSEWTGEARALIRRNPIAAVAGAIVVGAALLRLVSSSRR